MNRITRIKPRRLYPGDTIGIIAPASPGKREAAEAGIKWLQSHGFQIELGKTVIEETGYLAGSDADRAADLNTMFASPAINGIICLRGGYGTMRLLNLIDYDLIKKHPKIFVGYSDITALHTSIGEHTGLITFHGPMAASDMGPEMPESSWNFFLRAVTLSEPLGPIDNPPHLPPPEFLVPGEAEGYLTGGNLSILASTLGTPYEINTSGKILCLEDVGEAPYRIDRMLTQLLLAGKLQAAAGIVCDVFHGCIDDEPPVFTVMEVLQDRLGSLNKPVLTNLYFGHTPEKATLPFGTKATLKTGEGLVITESGTTD